MYDASSVATEILEEAINFEYEVELKMLIGGYSAGLIQVAGTASVTVTMPQDYIKSSEPLSGNLRIKCIDYTGEQNYSSVFPYYSNHWHIENMVMIGCDRFVDRVQVVPSGYFAYNANGIQLVLTFRGYDRDPGQFEFELEEGNNLADLDNLVILS